MNRHASFSEHSTKAMAPSSSSSCQHILCGNIHNSKIFIQAAT